MRPLEPTTTAAPLSSPSPLPQYGPFLLYLKEGRGGFRTSTLYAGKGSVAKVNWKKNERKFLFLAATVQVIDLTLENSVPALSGAPG